jgi:pimeloyl-ACP methyl ester carboxylesterase
MAGDLHHLVRNELGIDRPLSVVGHDLCSMVAFAYALRYRDDVVYRELDHDADIHRVDIAAHGKLTVPVLASGGGVQTLAANYAPMCEEIAIDVTGHLVPDAGHWVAEENPDYFCRMFIEFDTSARTRRPSRPNH